MIRPPIVNPGQSFWTCTHVGYQNESEAGGNHHVYITTLDEQGRLLNGIPVEYGFPNPDHPDDTRTQRTGEQGVSGQTNFGMYGPGGMCPADPHSPGPYFFHIVQPSVPSDLIWGPCMPGDHHVNYLLTFQRVSSPTPPPPPPPPPPVEGWVTVYQDDKVLLQEMK